MRQLSSSPLDSTTGSVPANPTKQVLGWVRMQFNWKISLKT